jgi:hypothetical protein
MCSLYCKWKGLSTVNTRTSTDDGSIDALATAFKGTYLETQYHYVQFLTEHLADCAAAFGGDLDCMLVLAVLGQRRLDYARQEADPPDPDPSRIAMSAVRIAEVSGIPRETVRRKLAICRKWGWVSQHPRHGWHISGTGPSAPARQSMAELEGRTFRRLARLYLRLSEILEGSSAVGVDGEIPWYAHFGHPNAVKAGESG